MAISVITISGLPGTGTTTAALALAGALSFRHVNQGFLFRSMAQEMGMELNEFGRFASANPHIDNELDSRQVAVARAGSVVLEGRLSGFMVHRAGVEAFKVLLKASNQVRWERIARRDGESLDAAMEKNRLREDIERNRFLEFYGFDILEQDIYDLVLDSGLLGPVEVLNGILHPFLGLNNNS